MSQRKMIFVTGASRSGTTLLSFVLRNHSTVFGLRELQYFGRCWDPRDAGRRLSRGRAIEAAAELFANQRHGVLVHRVDDGDRWAATRLVNSLGDVAADPAELFAAAVGSLANAAGKPVPCEQTPRYIFYARQLLDRYPQARFVHLVRDPRAVMASQKRRWRRRSLADVGMEVPRYEALRVWVNYHPYTVTKLWSRATRAALELRDHPRFTLLRYEDLVQQPEQTIRMLCSRLGLDFEPTMLDVGHVNSSHLSGQSGGRRGMRAEAIDRWRSVLTPAEAALTERCCGQLMRAFAYEPRSGSMGRLARLRFATTYLAHLGAVLVVNPGRARVQAKALLQAGSAQSIFDRRRHVEPSGAATVAGVAAEPTVDAGEQAIKRFIGLRFMDVPLAVAASALVDRAIRGERTQVFFVNAHCVNEAAKNPGYAGVLANAPYVFADGVGMAIAARVSGTRLEHNVNGTDLFPLLCRAAASRSVPIALLGARPGVAEACKHRIETMFPGLRVAWTAHGYLGPDEESVALERLNQSGARMLFVAKGVPCQEAWMASHADRLEAPVVLGVGALLDFYSGAVRRAPRLVRELRSEWLYRLMLEPRRLARRYLLGNPAFLGRTLLWRSLSHPLPRNPRRTT